MLLASVIKSTSLLLVQWCLLLPTSFFVSDVAAWQTHSPNSVTAYLLDFILSFTSKSSNMFLIYQSLQ